MPAAARVLKTLVLGVGRVVGVARAQQVGSFGIIAAAGVQVADHQGDGRARRVAVVHAGEELDGVGLGAGGGQAVAAGAATIHCGGDGSPIDGQPRREAIQHRADRRAMALAKNRHADGVSKGIFHKILLGSIYGKRIYCRRLSFILF